VTNPKSDHLQGKFHCKHGRRQLGAWRARGPLEFHTWYTDKVEGGLMVLFVVLFFPLTP